MPKKWMATRLLLSTSPVNKLYNAGPSGYPGDEDQGAMSSWYVLSAMGLYALAPTSMLLAARRLVK